MDPSLDEPSHALSRSTTPIPGRSDAPPFSLSSAMPSDSSTTAAQPFFPAPYDPSMAYAPRTLQRDPPPFGYESQQHWSPPPPAGPSIEAVEELTYELVIVQSPQRGRMCGFGDKDRRPLSPPLIVKLVVRDRAGNARHMTDIDLALLVASCDLWTGDQRAEANFVNQAAKASAAAPSPVASTSRLPPPPPPAPRPASQPRPASRPASQPSFTWAPPQFAQFFAYEPPPLPPRPRSQPYALPVEPHYVLPPSSSHSGGQAWWPPPTGLSGGGASGPPSPLEGSFTYRRGSLASLASSLGPPTPSPTNATFFQTHVVRPPSSQGYPFTGYTIAAPTLADAIFPPSLPLPAVPPKPAPTPPPPAPALSSTSFCNLVGNLAGTASVLRDLELSEGAYWVFPELSVRSEGVYTIRVQLVNLGDSPSAPILATAFSSRLEVYSPKRFPGMVEPTALSSCLAQQGVRIPTRRKRGRDSDDD